MATLLHHHLPVVDALAIGDLVDKVARAARADTHTGADPRTHAQRPSDAHTDLVLGRTDRPRITPTVVITTPAATIAGASDE
ncbi:hypothetical protein ACEXOS_007055 [Herbiconiux sp. P16]|uniref:hypothetical protein n=1 Tax=Herbiconiux wuyangfengii TaxID=3342794 RepID=UPI0035B840C5